MVVSAFVAAGVQLRDSQGHARDDLRARMDARIELSAGFVGSYVTQLVARVRNQAEHWIADPELDHDAFMRFSDSIAAEGSVVVDGKGRVLVALSNRSALIGQPAPDPSGVLAVARAGGLAISAVHPSTVTGLPVMAVATPYQAGTEQRVISATFDVPLPSISAFLRAGSADKGNVGYLIDASGNIVAASSGMTGFSGTLSDVDADLGANIVRADRGTYDADGGPIYFTSAPVPGTPWQVVRSTSEESLLAGVNGSNRLIPWILFWMVAALAVVAGLAAMRYARGRRQLAIARDEAMQASAMKSQFLANMSHEIRTPLNGVIGMNSLLLDTCLTGEQRELVESAQQSGENLLELINDILDLSKIEAGRMAIEPVPFDVRELVAEALASLSPAARDQQILLTSSVAVDVPAVVLSDRRRIRQILANLLANAVKFTSAGGVDVAVRVAETTAEGCLLEMIVSDTGIGIDPAVQSAVFEPFVQADSSTTRRFGGTGLGLPISDRLAQLLGGSLRVASKPGVGSRFTLVLPVTAGAAETLSSAQPAAQAPPTTTAIPALSRGTVLVAEDNPINQRVVVAMLRRLGYQADPVGDGEQAVAAARATSPVAILMDCQMPVMDGYEATRRIRAGELAEGRTPVPIIALTAAAMEGDRERALDAGMNDYITKPLAIDALRIALGVADQSLVPTPEVAHH